ncbi:hypothetical protein [Winogradskyella flava]|uniref:Uncharacterized protein n=1 Tax=Winogradskyella flava TaxID=1884876 RepID=A0A842IRY8_9FLAO|nr:hypothetical protein [Winogradskyella flava]MBC2844197.1 hypothetical protein [Winogradskyella flava]
MKKKIALFCSLYFIIISISGQNKKFEEVSIDDFLTETQYGSDNADTIDIIWWIPTEYWNVVFSQDPTTSISDTEDIVNLVKDYVFVMALKGKIGTFGGITYDDENIVREQLNVNYMNTDLKRVDNDNLNPDIVNFLSMMKPMMKNMMGPMGENMQFIVFESPDRKNNVIPIDPYSSETIKFELGDFKKDVMLPLACLLEEKVCPETDEEHNGKWTFCPYHGVKLVDKKQ